MLAVNPSGAGTHFSTMWRRRPTWFFRQPPRRCCNRRALYPRHFRNRRRSGRQRPCCEPAAAGQPTPQVLLISRARTGKWLELLPYAEIYLGPLGAAAAALAVEAIATSVGDTSELESAVGGFMVIPDRSLHVQPERTDHFADCPSPPSSDLSVSLLR